jgi:nitrate/nitrite-specific signal transduction histidine kinase
VHDNGYGIATEDLAKPQAFGILGMQERARNLGGEAGVRRTRTGTAVKLRLPRALQETAAESAADAQLPHFESAVQARLALQEREPNTKGMART